MSLRRKGTQWNRENRVHLIYKRFPALGTEVMASHRALRDLDLLGQIRSWACQPPTHQPVDKGVSVWSQAPLLCYPFQGPCHYHSQELALCVLSWGSINPGLVLLVWYIPWQWESCQGKWVETLPACSPWTDSKGPPGSSSFQDGVRHHRWLLRPLLLFACEVVVTITESLAVISGWATVGS